MDKTKLQPAIIGGVALGLLSAIPLINLVNTCCCAWAILGGMLAGYMYIKKSQTPVSAGEGAKIGAIAGAIGGVISLVIGIPLALLTNALMFNLFREILGSEAARNPVLAQYLRQMRSGSMLEQLPRVIGASIGRAVLLTGFATLGSILAVSLFEKRKGGPTAPPPMPPPFQGGSQQGSGGGYGVGYPPGSNPYGR